MVPKSIDIKLLILLLLILPCTSIYAQPLGLSELSQFRLLNTDESDKREHQTQLEPLLFWHAGKLMVSGLIMGTALTDPDVSQNDRVLVGGASLLLVIPAIGVLRNTAIRRPTAIRNWRIVGFVVDLGLSATLISLGVRQAMDSNPTNDWTAVATLSVGGLGLLLSGLNLLPLRVEQAKPLEPTVK